MTPSLPWEFLRWSPTDRPLVSRRHARAGPRFLGAASEIVSVAAKASLSCTLQTLQDWRPCPLDKLSFLVALPWWMPQRQIHCSEGPPGPHALSTTSCPWRVFPLRPLLWEALCLCPLEPPARKYFCEPEPAVGSLHSARRMMLCVVSWPCICFC